MKAIDRIASKALPCPFCGENLVVHSDHQGSFMAHKDQFGACFISVVQILDSKDLADWNKRSEPTKGSGP